MNLKEKLSNLPQNQKKNIIYWLAIILVVDLIIVGQHIYQYWQTGMCRNYMVISSPLHSCTALEFAKNGWAWLSFADVFVFLPAAVIMIMASVVVEEVFGKKE